MNICTICGSKIQSNWRFCPECGGSIKSGHANNALPGNMVPDQVVDNPMVGLFVLDEKGKFIYCNEAFKKTAGYQKENLTKLTWFDMIHLDDISFAATTVEDLLSLKTREANFEIRLLTDHKEPVWVNMSLMALSNQSERAPELLGMCFSIAGQKAAEEEVKRQNTIMTLLHETSLAIINRLDVKGLLVTILKRAASLAGTPHGYMYLLNRETGTMEMEIGIGRYVKARVRNLKPYQGFGGAVWRAGQPVAIDDYSKWPGRLTDLPFYPKAVIGVPLKSGDEVIGIITLSSLKKNRVFSQSEVLRLGQFGQLASIALNNALIFSELKQEIAERKKAEEALYESTQKLRAIVESARDFIYLKDNNSIYQEVNPAMYCRLGVTREEVIGKNDEAIFGKDVARRTREIDKRVLAGETVEEEIVLNIDNMPVIFGNLATPLRTKDTNITGISGIMRDITERKRAEKEMLHAREIVVRSEKLASLGTMAAGISHEINQPLNSIKVSSSGLIYCYKKGISIPLDEMMEEIEEISLQADRIDKIIKHMRSFTRSKDSKALTACNLNEIIEHSLELIGSQISDHGIILHKNLTADIPLVLGTETGLEEVVINLVVNAIQALDGIDKKNKEISVRTSISDRVIMEINDNGPGIDPEITEKIFDPFFTTKENRNNMGFGLSIAHSIIASYQGKINISSADHLGTSFLVEFPVCES